MKHKIIGTLTVEKDLSWHANIYKGKIDKSFSKQNEAVAFIEEELTSVMDNYDFEVCYRVENKILGRRSYILMKRDKSGKIIHTSLSRYEYAKTHFFFFSKDKRRKMIDYKNPDFNSLTRHCISTRSKIAKAFLLILFASVVVLGTLLGLFVGSINSNELEYFEKFTTAPKYHTEMLAMISISFATSVILLGIYFVRYRMYSMLVKSDSAWHESYSNVKWRDYYKFVLFTRYFAGFFSWLFAGATIAFGVLFTKSAMYDSYHQIALVTTMHSVFIVSTIFVAASAYITTYYVIRFRVSLYHISPKLMTVEGEATYKRWLKGEEVSKEDEMKSFHPIEEHLLYPNAEIINENPKFAKLNDEQVKQVRKDIKDYYKLILKDKFGHSVEPEVMLEAKKRYAKW